MVLPVPKRRAFRNVFKRTTGRVFKARPKPAPQTPHESRPPVRAASHRRPGGQRPFSVLMIVNALREIKYYQSSLMSDKLVIPKAAFTRLVREILQAQLRREWGPEHMMRQPDWRIEEDALVCLQTMSEHIIVMMMEMW